ncbi:ABC transporter permease [Actinopolyspora saharensis]|uniref:ABC transporter permease n=1 Tax=Actinopolyspora saharensis TaxID=995062 RepID=UPI003F66D794
MITSWTAIFSAELKLLFRNTAVVMSTILLPLLFGAGFAFFGKIMPSPLGWGYYAGMQLIMVFGMTSCVMAASSVSYRRDALYLKRLRCGEASNATVLIGTVSPVALLSAIQCLLMLLITGLVGPAVPTNPLLLVGLVLAGIAMSMSIGVAATGLTSSGEQAQTVATPFFFLLIGSLLWAGIDIADGLNAVQRLLPGGAILELTMLSYDSGESFVGQLMDGALPLIVLAGWTALGLLAANQYFRWEPRS